MLISHRHNYNRWRLLTFTTQHNFLVASTNELDQPANRFCYAWERLVWPQEFIFRCVKSQKRVCLHFGSPTRTVIWVTLSLWVCSLQVTPPSLCLSKGKLQYFVGPTLMSFTLGLHDDSTCYVSDHASLTVDTKSLKNSHSWFILFFFFWAQQNCM